MTVSEDPRSLPGLVAAQLRALADQLETWPVAAVTECDGGPGGATPGMHVRHCLDHVQAFVTGVPARAIDYDARARCDHTERDPGRAATLARTLAGEVVRVVGAAGLTAPVAVHAACAVTGPETAQASTVGRELQFLVSHTVHHLAMVGALLRAAGVEVDPAFGVAPSTLRHRAAHGVG